MADFLWSFWFFSLLGWLLERIFAALTRSPFQRRRCLLLEPLCPVYGLGLTAVLTLPPPLLSGWRLYLSGTVVTTAVEYAYHWWGETFLGVRFWDYTGLPGNLRGRVCLPFSLSWGLLTVPAVTRVAPLLELLERRIPACITWLCLMAFTADAVCSLRFLAVTHDLEALRAAVWPVSADR